MAYTSDRDIILDVTMMGVKMLQVINDIQKPDAEGEEFFLCPFQPVSLWDMLRFYADKFVAIVRAIDFLNNRLRSQASPDEPFTLNTELKAFSNDNLSELCTMLLEIGLRWSAMDAKRLLESIRDDTVHYDDLFHRIDELTHRIRDELSDPHFLVVPPHRVKYYNPLEPLFGVDVNSKFQNVEFDISEAGNCFALVPCNIHSCG